MSDIVRDAVDDRHVDKLVSRASQGDSGAFGRLYDLFADRIYGFALLRIHDHHDAEDLTETVFLKAWKAIGSYDLRGLPFEAWLFRIARNAIIDEVRKRRRSPETEELAQAECLPGDRLADVEALRGIEGERVRGCVARLGDEQAEVVVLRFFWDLDVAATADAMGRTAGAVKALQHRAMRNLARMLREEEDDGSE